MMRFWNQEDDLMKIWILLKEGTKKIGFCVLNLEVNLILAFHSPPDFLTTNNNDFCSFTFFK